MKADIDMVVALARRGLSGIVIEKLIRASRRLNRLACKACNEQVDEEKHNRAVLNTFNKAAALLPEGQSLFHQSDPRGCSLYVYRATDALATGHPIQSVYNSIGSPVF